MSNKILKMKTKKVDKRFFRQKKAQVFGMSFGVIFSVILIVFILVVAGIAIRHFLNLKKCAQIGMFIDGLQEDIDKAWAGQKSDFTFSGQLPGDIEYICFANLSDSLRGGEIESKVYTDISVYSQSNGNLFFYPRENSCDIPYVNMKHIDIQKITSSRNPYCFEIKEGKIEINIDKEFNDALVCLGDNCEQETREIINRGVRTTSRSICQTADTDDICNWLDLAKGKDYKQACCKDYNLCC